MRTQCRSSRPSARSGSPWPISATTRSTSSTIAFTWRSLGAERSRTRRSPPGRRRPPGSDVALPFASAAQAARHGESRASARSLSVLLALLPPDQIRDIGPRTRACRSRRRPPPAGGSPGPVLSIRRSLDAHRQPQTSASVGLGLVVGVVAASLSSQCVEGGGIAGDGDLGAARHQPVGRVALVSPGSGCR